LTNTLLLLVQLKSVTKSMFVVLLPLLLIVITAQPYSLLVLSDADDDEPSTFQLDDLHACTIQEKNIQGRTIIGTILADVCQGTEQSETILGLQDNDILSGHGGDDIIQGNEGDDKILGNAGDDVLQGSRGDDKIDGGGRNDILIGGGAGGGRNDIQIGGGDDDILSGEDGNDVLYGVTGNDMMRGGLGANEFICGDGIDTVLDYNPAKGDIISNDCEIVNT
jgi:Ca2+-binding RTX toxin-like protein